MRNDNLFRFEVFCTSKQLGDAIASLSGKVAQISPPQLCPNVKRAPRGNGVTPIASGNLIEMFAEYIRSKRATEINSTFTQDFMESVGRPRGSASYLMTKMSNAGLLKNVGTSPSDSRWKVLAAAKRKPTAKPKKKPAAAAAEA